MTRRVYLLGTDTEIGKTALACALLHWARREGVRAVPFKPAQSGSPGEQSDIARLLRAADLSPDDAPLACPLQYDAPLAPGLAEDPTPFMRPAAANLEPDPAVVTDTVRSLESWEARTAAELVIIEGAGGLHVPMPGGTWQPTWIAALATDVIIVGRSGLGTINHTLLTIDAALAAGFPVRGFFLVTRDAAIDPSRRDNAQLIATARGVPYLGTLPRLPDPDGPGRKNLLAPLVDALLP